MTTMIAAHTLLIVLLDERTQHTRPAQLRQQGRSIVCVCVIVVKSEAGRQADLSCCHL